VQVKLLFLADLHSTGRGQREGEIISCRSPYWKKAHQYCHVHAKK
jgi:hypothetical protein